MPHVYIRETDSTKAGREEDVNVVYIPILQINSYRTAGKTDATSLDNPIPEVTKEPQLVETLSELDKVVDTEGAKDATNAFKATSIGYLMAKQFLQLGLPVLLEILADAESINWDKLTDKGLYNVKYLTTGGLQLDKTTTDAAKTNTISQMLAAAAKRGDCVALLDHSDNISAEGTTYEEAVRKDLGVNDASGSTTAGALYSNENLKYAAAFSPWGTYDIDGVSAKLPPSVAYLSAYAQSITNGNPNWYAPAGKFRGTIPNLTALSHTYGDAACDALQSRKINADGSFGANDNLGIAINPVVYVRAFGNYVVWGNRTLIDNNKNGGLTASSFLNVRNLCCDIKKELYAAAKEFTFEQNGDILWVNFSARIRPLLDKALSGSGIRGYKLTKESANRKGMLRAKVKIVPIEGVDDFWLDLELADSIETVSESI